MNVKLQAWLRMIPRQIHLARRHLEMPVNEMHQPVRQVAGKIRPEVSRAVFYQTPRDIHARIPLAGQLDIRIGFVVPQQNVEARLILLDQVVLERQRLFLVVDQNVIDVARLGDQRPGLDLESLSSLK